MKRHLVRVPDSAPRLCSISNTAGAAPATETTSFIVMELGSAWPAHHDGGCEGESANVHVIAQQEDEEASSLMVRVVGRISRLDESDPTSARSAVLSCSDRTDRATLASRAMMARAILCSITRAGRGKLVLAGEDCPATNHALLALADELKDRIRSSTVSIAIELSPRAVEVAAWPVLHVAAV